MAPAYRGALGRTRTATVHVTDPRGALVAVQVTTSLDATSDPELVDRLSSDTLNVARLDGRAPIPLAVPVLYHDPTAEVMVLVLGEAHRHRELEERIAVLEQLRADPAAVPPYAKDFAVVFGGAGLRAYLAQRTHLRDAADELDRRTRELERHANELDTVQAELDPLPGDGRLDDTDRFELPADPDDPGEPGDDPLTTELIELPLAVAAPAGLGDMIARGESGCHLDRDSVHVVVIAGDPLVHGLAGALEVRLVLHRTPDHPVIALVIGPPAALRAAARPQLAVVPLDVASERDRGVLHELSHTFELTLLLVTDGQPVRRATLIAPLAGNVAYILHAADDHLRGIAADGKPDYRRARELVLGAGFDLLGTNHPERSEFRGDKLAQIATAQQLRRALAVARRFTRPVREDYLVCTRGFPLPRWQNLRRDILARAVAWGLWMGPDLAQVAVSEGLARSRRDLIGKLDRGFESLRREARAFDLDPEAADDNITAIAAEARALGVELRSVKANGAGAIASDIASVVSGSISSTPTRGTPWTSEGWTTDELLVQLERPDSAPGGRTQRVEAALALCDHAEPRAAGPVIAAALRMSRNEAVRVLARSVKFGAAAQPALLDGLASSKAFLRHGSALALALLRSADATHAVLDLLLSEPTELWREIARAIGRIGVEALAPLAERYGRLGERTKALEERVAWAMAHIGVRGGKAAVAAMATGSSRVAPVAAKALARLVLAAKDHVREPQGATAAGTERDLTVNHAFSRQFFEALDQGHPEAAMPGPGTPGTAER